MSRTRPRWRYRNCWQRLRTDRMEEAVDCVSLMSPYGPEDVSEWTICWDTNLQGQKLGAHLHAKICQKESDISLFLVQNVSICFQCLYTTLLNLLKVGYFWIVTDTSQHISRCTCKKQNNQFRSCSWQNWAFGTSEYVSLSFSSLFTGYELLWAPPV